MCNGWTGLETLKRLCVHAGGAAAYLVTTPTYCMPHTPHLWPSNCRAPCQSGLPPIAQSTTHHCSCSPQWRRHHSWNWEHASLLKCSHTGLCTPQTSLGVPTVGSGHSGQHFGRCWQIPYICSQRMHICMYIFFFINSVCAHTNDQSKSKELQDLATQLMNLILPTGTVYMYTSMR